ncbi:MAG: GNAT family N-acetyltransferase [Chloroflexi bacterium]|nr:GNAT family N-acetyltransferase [Chloroflexota bacterium]MCC6894553.1 GNAT family N-acetyltransferase [Anaerolineae bacterium]
MVAIKNPMLLEIPDSFQSERLIIRAPRAGDGAAVNEAVRESLDNLRPWMPWADHEPELEESEESVRRGAARWILREDLWLLLFRKSDGLYVGGSGLHRMDWSVPSFEIGYWVRKSLEGQGYVTEAVKAITDIAFMAVSAERVEIRCDTRNERSAAVAKRAGYMLEATLHHDGRDPNGDLRDTYIFGMTQRQYLIHKGVEITE